MSTDKAITRPSARMDRRRTEGDHHYQAPKGWMLCGSCGETCATSWKGAKTQVTDEACVNYRDHR